MTNRLLVALLCIWFSPVQSATCPDPNTTSLAWGEIPPPWESNPFSTMPQGEADVTFVRATILTAGKSSGVQCTYKNSLGPYSIWWQVGVKRPSRMENSWHETLGGYACTDSIEACIFYPG